MQLNVKMAAAPPPTATATAPWPEQAALLTEPRLLHGVIQKGIFPALTVLSGPLIAKLIIQNKL